MNRRGVALALTLWLLLVLGIVALAVSGGARSEANVIVNLRARTVARYAAESGVLAARQRIERLLAAAATPAAKVEGLGRLDTLLSDLQDVDLGAARFAVAALDLNAHLDVNRADGETLVALFAQFTGAGRAQEAVAALDERRRDVALRHLEELARAPAVGPELARAITPYVTTNGDGLVNVNSAPEPVLAAVLGAPAARALIARRQSAGPYRSVLALLNDLRASSGGRAAPLGRLSISPTRLLLVSRGWEEGHALTHEVRAAFMVSGTRLVLVAWEEGDL